MQRDRRADLLQPLRGSSALLASGLIEFLDL
jgi:hypothetical protein